MDFSLSKAYIMLFFSTVLVAMISFSVIVPNPGLFINFFTDVSEQKTKNLKLELWYNFNLWVVGYTLETNWG